jgi:hypothetical protein
MTMSATNNPDLSTLAAYPGKLRGNLFRKYYNGLEFAQQVTVMPNVKYKEPLPKIVVGDRSRPFTGSFKPKSGDLSFGQRTLIVEPSQRDMEINPENYRKTYFSEFLSPGSDSSKKEIPFAQWTWETFMLAGASDINDYTAWSGKGTAAYTAFSLGSTASSGDLIYFNDGNRVNYYKVIASVTNVQTPLTHPAKFEDHNAHAIVKGWGQIILDEIGGGGLSPETIGALDSTNAFSGILELYRSTPTAMRKRDLTAYMSYTDFDAMVDQYQNSFGKYTMPDDGKPMFLPRTNNKCLVQPCSWITGRRIIITPKENIVYGTDLLSDQNTITTVPSHYTIEASVKSLHGFNFADLEAMKINDQA